jgi:phenylacetate-CoA ligase
MFVHPRQLAGVLARFPEVHRHRAVVDRFSDSDVFALWVELHPGGAQTPELLDRISDAVREVLHVRPGVEFAAPGSIAADAQSLVDQRTWE